MLRLPFIVLRPPSRLSLSSALTSINPIIIIMSLSFIFSYNIWSYIPYSAVYRRKGEKSYTFALVIRVSSNGIISFSLQRTRKHIHTFSCAFGAAAVDNYDENFAKRKYLPSAHAERTKSNRFFCAQNERIPSVTCYASVAPHIPLGSRQWIKVMQNTCGVGRVYALLRCGFEWNGIVCRLSNANTPWKNGRHMMGAHSNTHTLAFTIAINVIRNITFSSLMMHYHGLGTQYTHSHTHTLDIG